MLTEFSRPSGLPKARTSWPFLDFFVATDLQSGEAGGFDFQYGEVDDFAEADDAGGEDFSARFEDEVGCERSLVWGVRMTRTRSAPLTT